MPSQQYDGKTTPPTKYTIAKDSCKYKCTSLCSCKYLQDRTEYDIALYTRNLKIFPVVKSVEGWNKH